MTNLNSKIEWTDCTWNVVTGCTKISPGCNHCYAERLTERFHGKGSFAEVIGPVDLAVIKTRNGTLPVAPLEIHYDQDTRTVEHPISWVIVGGESGPGTRPMHPDWVRSLRDQCQASGVSSFFFKQWGEWIPQPIYYTDRNHHVVMPNGHDRGIPWPGWKLDQPEAVVMERVGKKRAHRELDGRIWDEFPMAVAT